MLEVLVYRSGCVGEFSWFLDGETVNKQFFRFRNDVSSSAMLSSDNNTFRTEKSDSTTNLTLASLFVSRNRFALARKTLWLTLISSKQSRRCKGIASLLSTAGKVHKLKSQFIFSWNNDQLDELVAKSFWIVESLVAVARLIHRAASTWPQNTFWMRHHWALKRQK